jgi:hypothetical protein
MDTGGLSGLNKKKYINYFNILSDELKSGLAGPEIAA